MGDEAGRARERRITERLDPPTLVERELPEAREVEGLGEAERPREEDTHSFEGLVVGVDRGDCGREIACWNCGDGEHQAGRRREGLPA